MKKKIYLLTTFVIAMIFIFTSCSNDDMFNEELETGLRASISKIDSLENDSIMELNEEDFPKVPKKKKAQGYYGEYVDIWSELYQLNGIDFFIQSTGFNYGNNTFETTGKGRELKLASFSQTNSKQKFRMKFLPASTGIPYLIYSTAENVPIGVGSYKSDPNRYVMYAKSSDSGSLFGFSWDFYLNDKNDAYILENQDIIGSTGSGSWWDIYYYSPTINNGSLSMTKRNNGINQQFTLIPDDNFEILSVELQHNRGTILSSKPVLLDENGISNYDNVGSIKHTFSYEKSRTDQTSFTEQRSITTKKSGGFNIGLTLSKVVSLGGNFGLEKGEQKTLTYGTNQTMSTKIAKSYDFVVPPMTRYVYTFTAFQHELNVPYIATVKGIKSQQIFKIRGEWKGVDYTVTDLRLTPYSLKNPTKKMSPIFVKPNN